MGFFVCDFLLRGCFVWYSLLAVGFLACFFLPRVSPHRYRSVVYRQAHPKYVLRTYAPSSPTPWVSPACFSTPTPSFRSATYRLASGVGFSACFFSSYAHAMGFPAYFSAPTPSFYSATYRLASRVDFLACFSSPTPTPWVSTLTFLLPRPVSAPRHID